MPSPAVNLILGGGYCREAETYFDACNPRPPPSRCHQIDRLIRDLKDWFFPKCDGMWLLAQHDPLGQSVLINVINPGLYTMTKTGTGHVITVDRGVVPTTPNTDYYITGIVLNTAGIKFGRDSAHMGIYSRTDNSNGAARSYDMGRQGSGWRAYIARHQSTATRAAMGINSSGTLADTTSGIYPGHIVWNRTASDAWAIYVNGNTTAITSDTDASAAPESGAIHVLGASSVGGGANELAAAWLGAALTPGENAEHNRVLRKYLRELGAAVV